eukprot:TRINITY_DN1884_c0_g1_i1.p2 TRINITY_DN1884_c0_g1~~TRINITY_DN1884_c0_g1_i1.p2  ORF type:complete len:289 (-),score=76.25 TRINITY_DN1884_c0_g1_i1:205-1071(-)
MSKKLALAMAANLLAPAAGWWCVGHMLVAEVAYQQLTPKELPVVEALVGYMVNQGNFTRNPTLTQSACWADDIKETTTVMEPWHFIDTPINPDNMPNVPPAPDQNVEFVITKFGETLKNAKSNTWEKAFALFNYVHFVGDIHQPLHCAELFLPGQFPDGDRGGNDFSVVYDGQTTNLHSFWDSVGELYANDPTRPLSPTDAANLTSIAKALTQKYTFDSATVEEYRTGVWGNESLALAKNVAYGTLKPGDTLTETYINKVRDVAQSQITLAGLRLAKQLQYNLGLLRI